MKQKEIAIPKTIFIATDYACIPFTEEADCDAYVIPSVTLNEAFTNCGLPGEKFPMRRCFSQKENRQDACTRLGLDPKKRYILAAGGSMGGGEIKKVIQMLADEIVRYNNADEQMYDELSESALVHVKVLGFTTDMAGYLKAADLFVTKPGVSSTDGIPMIHIAPIPGCETYTARFFSQHGMSAFCHTTSRELADALEILAHETARSEMVENQKR